MLMFALRRLGFVAVVLLVVSIFAFLVPYVTGRDPAREILQSRVAERAPDEEVLEAIREELGLNESLFVQYQRWLANALEGDLGYSMVSKEPVGELLVNALRITFLLTTVTLTFSLVVSLPMGALAAARRGGWLDNAIVAVTQTGVAIPEYWLGPLLILLFALTLGLVPSAGLRGPEYLILPALTLALRPIAYITRISRAAMLDVLSSPYITAARARGLSYAKTVVRHGIRNASLPVLSVFAMWFAGLLGGSVVVEVIFAVPGMGRLMYEGVLNSDIPLIQAGLMTIVALAVVFNVLADLLYTVIDPTVKLRR